MKAEAENILAAPSLCLSFKARTEHVLENRVLDFVSPLWGEEKGPEPLQEFKVTGD